MHSVAFILWRCRARVGQDFKTKWMSFFYGVTQHVTFLFVQYGTTYIL